MAEASYDFDALDQSITNSGQIRDYMDAISGNVGTFLSSCDSRVLTYYSGDFTNDLRNSRTAFNNDYDNMNGFGNWLSDTYQDLIDTNQNAIDIANSLDSTTNPVSSTLNPNGPGDSQNASPLDLSLVTASIDTVTSATQSAPATSLTFINPEEFNNLPQEVQDAVRMALSNVGYNDDEIASILNGEIGVRTCVLEAVSSALETTLSEHPELRQTILDLYGFDPFDEDGKLDPQLVTVMLLIDSKNPNDQYDIIKLLHDKYGVDIVDPVQLTTLSSQLETLLTNNQDLRARILEKYGFDIFNPDGTINKSRLALAMLMDGADPNDDFNLAALITQLSNKNVMVNAYDSVQSAVTDNNKSAGLVAVGAGLGGSPSTKVGGTLLGVSEQQQEKTQLTNLQHHIESVKPTTPAEEAKKQNTAALALGLGGLGALGVTGGGIAANKKEKEEEDEEKQSSNEFELLESGEGIQKEEEDDKKDWLYGLGIGLSAASIVGKELSKDDDDDDNDDNPEQDFQL